MTRAETTVAYRLIQRLARDFCEKYGGTPMLFDVFARNKGIESTPHERMPSHGHSETTDRHRPRSGQHNQEARRSQKVCPTPIPESLSWQTFSDYVRQKETASEAWPI
jgi:hypothetical protein